jgi:hypothetical protein
VGGLVSDYRAFTEVYRRENREVRLHECRSACTLALSLPNVCVYPSSVLKFHSAYHRDTKQVDPFVSAELFNSYPEAVRRRLGSLTREYRSLSGRELIALGVRDCTKPAAETMIARARPAPQAQPAQVAMAAPGANPFAGVVDGVKSLFGGIEPTRQQVAYATSAPSAQGIAQGIGQGIAQGIAPVIGPAFAPPAPPIRPADLGARAAPRPVVMADPVVRAGPVVMAGAAPILPLAFTPYALTR